MAKLELWGQAEIIRELNTNRATLYYWRHERGFPEPIAVLQMGAVWDARKVRQWAAKHDLRDVAKSAPDTP